ncbi:MAG: riboflavin synthase [Saprospiraceae bacterium]|nr:riboflavin synthase [Saprospiraceae bacterium]
MFTGIVETVGIVKAIEKKGKNLQFQIVSNISSKLNTDQSVSHNGVCLTVTHKTKTSHFVTAINETLNKTNLGNLTIGSKLNLERALKINQRLDGHLVSGHIDKTTSLLKRESRDGSYLLHFKIDKKDQMYLIPHGSITINGISLTIAKLKKKSFVVAIIPYTWDHTNLKELNIGDEVNIEFDLLGKYILRSQKIIG